MASYVLRYLADEAVTMAETKQLVISREAAVAKNAGVPTDLVVVTVTLLTLEDEDTVINLNIVPVLASNHVWLPK